MKKIKNVFLLMLCLFFVGCTKINNEIYNKSYNVGPIDIISLEQAIEEVVENCSPAILGVSVYTRQDIYGYNLVGVGSGIVYKGYAELEDGSEVDLEETINSNNVKTYHYYLVTNRHVIKGGDVVKIYDGTIDEELNAKVLQYDDQVDLAVVSFEHTKYIKPLNFADSDSVKAGSFAIAIGNPSGFEYYGSATFGIVSSSKRYISDDTDGDSVNDWDAEYIQHDVAINPGNSGGALLNIKGEVIGVNTMKFVSDDVDNMGFSIPSNLVKQVVVVLEKGEKPIRLKLGVNCISLKDITEKLMKEENFIIPQGLKYGMYITDINSGGLAESINLKVNDIIVEFNGVLIKESYQLRAELSKFVLGSGEKTIIKYYRDGVIKTQEIIF